MAKKFEKIDNYFVVTDTVTMNKEINHPVTDIRFDYGTDTVFFKTLEGTQSVKSATYAFSDIVNSTGSPFVSFEVLLTYLRQNTGFSSASGGSEAFLGLVDYNDLSTQTTPINVPSGLINVALTNDGLGPFTNKNFVPVGIGDSWNTTTQLFDFSDINLGSNIFYRLDISITTTANNQEIFISIELAIGGASYILNIEHQEYKSIGTYPITSSNFIYIGDENTRDNGAKFLIKSDSAATIVVNGWVLYYNLLK